MDGTPLGKVPAQILHDSSLPSQEEVKNLACDWLARLQSCFKAHVFEELRSLFIEDCWWRDIAGLSWDFSTKHGWDDIRAYLSNAPCPIENIKALQSDALQPIMLNIGDSTWIQTGFEFNTAHGQGRGLLKLINVDQGQWKAWTIFTQLEELNCCNALSTDGHAQATSAVGDTGRDSVSNSVQDTGLPTPPQDRLDSDMSNRGEPPRRMVQVAIIGAGQNGLALAARLKRMGISALLLDRHERLGDSWRKRYKSIRLHTPSYTDSWPFLAYPTDWPKFPTRDMIADFAEQYGQAMGLEVWLNTNVQGLSYQPDSREWHISLQQPNGDRTLQAKHVVLATGVYADQPVIPPLPNQEHFTGQIYHSSQHSTALQISDVHNKRVAVIGAGPSGHDVAQDFANHSAKAVSLIQRQAIFSMSMAAIESTVFFLWNIPGLSTEDADLIGNSTPIAVIRAMSVDMTKAMAKQDEDMIAGLRKGGMALKVGEDGYGVADHQLILGGQYYIDQGANQMIADGRIGVFQCDEGVSHFDGTGIALKNGKHVDADVVVMATGYQRNISTVRELMGTKVAERLKSFGDLDEEQERGGWWRNTGIPGFWYMTGSFMWARQFSLPLALQIAAVEHGLNKDYYSNTDVS